LIDANGRAYFGTGTNPFNPPTSGEAAELLVLNPDGSLFWRLSLPPSPFPPGALALSQDGTLYAVITRNGNRDLLVAIR